MAMYDETGIRRVSAVVLLLLALLSHARAATPQKSDYVSLGMSGGYSTLIGKFSGMDVYGGFGGGMHLGYEYRDGKMWLSAFGEMQYVSSHCQSDIEIDDVHFVDTREEKGLMHYEMASRLKESQNFGILNLCLMAGYCSDTHNKGGFYVGAGVKVGGKFDFSNSVNQKYRTYATYNEYIDPYHDMPDHYYTDYETNDTVSFDAKLNVSVIGEVGWNFRMTRCDKVKLGFFIEAGLTNIMANTPVRYASVNPANISVVKSYSAYNREEMQNKYIVPIVVGVKVSLLFNVSRLGEKCHTCPCYRKR